jgi:hypothetical protein
MFYVGFHRTVTNNTTIKDNLLQVLLSNGFLRLRICKAFDIGGVVFSDTWTGSDGLHTLNLWMRNPVHHEQIRSICPQLHRLTTDNFPMDGFAGNALT